MKKISRVILFITTAILIFIGILAWSPWVTKEFARSRILATLSPSCSVYKDWSADNSDPLTDRKNKKLFGREYWMDIQCETKTQYTKYKYFVSALGTIHAIYTQAYWIHSPLLSQLPPSCTLELKGRVLKPVHTVVRKDANRYPVEVKFIFGSGIRLRNGRFISITGIDVVELNNIIDKYKPKIERAYSHKSEEDLEKYDECFDFNLYYVLDNVAPTEKIEQLIDQLNALPIVDIADVDYGAVNL